MPIINMAFVTFLGNKAFTTNTAFVWLRIFMVLLNMLLQVSFRVDLQVADSAGWCMVILSCN